MEYAKVRAASPPIVGGISVAGLHRSYGKTEVLRDVNLEMREGEVVSIIGPSCPGKSTFLRCLNYLEVPTAVTITICGTTVEAGLCKPDSVTAHAGQLNWPTTQSNPDLTAAINADIDALRKDGTIANTLKKYGMDPSAADVGQPDML